MSETSAVALSPISSSMVEPLIQRMELLGELNNEGASHLENSLFTEAIVTFTSALSIVLTEVADVSLQERAAAIVDFSGMDNLSLNSDYMCTSIESVKPKRTKRRKHKRRNSIGSVGSKESSIDRPSRRDRRRHTGRRRARSAMGRMLATNETIVTEDIAQSPHKYVHSKPLRVMDRYNLPSKLELAIYTIYNLALAYHLQALATDESESAAIVSTRIQGATIWSKIISLYKVATDLVEQQYQHVDETNDAVVDPQSPLWSPTYTIALPNNLACAYHAGGNVLEADVLWGQVLSHVWCILDFGCTSQVECFSNVLENAAHLMDPNPVGRIATAA